MKELIARICFRFARFFRETGSRFRSIDSARRQIIRDWKQQEGETKLRYTYTLDEQATVFDLGGYQGDFASEIYARYRAKVLVFEPHPVYAGHISRRFEKNPEVEVYPFGLGARDEVLLLGTEGESSSTLMIGDKNKAVEAEIKNAKSFLELHEVRKIDLLKINIEGGEYELLEHLLKEDLIGRIENLQIQFHHFVPDAVSRMKAIKKALAETHELTYEFEFLWENWQKKN